MGDIIDFFKWDRNTTIRDLKKIPFNGVRKC
jgi:hypothetical protein